MRRLILEETLSNTAVWSRRCAILAVPLILFGIAFARFGYADLPNAIAVCVFAFSLAVLALILAVYSLAQIWESGETGVGHAISAMIIAIAILAWPGYLTLRSLQLPRLSDISTDIDNPPVFSTEPKLVAARGGFVLAAIPRSQREPQLHAYPRVQPQTLDIEAVEAFQIVQNVVKTMGWKVLDATPPVRGRVDGHIEAISRSLVMGVPSYICVRVHPLGEGSRVDMRALTRLGAHDFGANADLIDSFDIALQTEIDAR